MIEQTLRTHDKCLDSEISNGENITSNIYDNPCSGTETKVSLSRMKPGGGYTPIDELHWYMLM